MKDPTALLGDLANLGHTERVCEKVESVVPGAAQTHVCDITEASASSTGVCEEGWEERRSVWVNYVCTMNALAVDNACTVTTTPITHDENIYHCTDRDAQIENRPCDVPVTVTVDKTFPYTCPITAASKIEKTCVNTLTVWVTPLCSANDAPEVLIRLEPFRTYGYRGSTTQCRLYATLACTSSAEDIDLTFRLNNQQVAHATALPFTGTFTMNNYEFRLDVKRLFVSREADATLNDPYIEISVTNVDTSAGTHTETRQLKHLIDHQQEWERWTETCQEGAS